MIDATAGTQGTGTTAEGQTNTGSNEMTRSDGGGNTGKTTFTNEQQAHIQRLMDEQSSRYKKNLSEAAAEITQLKSRGKDTTIPDNVITQLKQQVDSLRNEKKTSELLKAISRHNVLDAAEISELTGRFIRLNDDTSLNVVNDRNEVVMDAQNAPMSIDEFIAGWLKTRPHHLRSSGTVGSGSTSAMFNGQGAKALTPDAIRNMSTDEFKQVMSGGVDIAGSGGQVYHFKNVQNPFNRK